MPHESRILSPGLRERTAIAPGGLILEVPVGWALLPPGDAALTRRVKADGPSWTVQEIKRRRTYSIGVWAPADRISALRAELEAERSTESYAKRRATAVKTREKKQTVYVEDFRGAVVAFLNFAPCHAAIAELLAEAVAAHATPVGSGTVARTERIPIEQRAQSAVIAWLRHQTTAYDNMHIERVRGKRREVRRMLAEQSRRLLSGYRAGDAIDPKTCKLQNALRADDV